MKLIKGERLDPRVVTVWVLESLNRIIFRVAIAAFLVFSFQEYLWVVRLCVGGAAIVFIDEVISIVLASRRWRQWQYSVNHQALEIVKGGIIRKEILIPLGGIEHVNITRGLIERLFGLRSLELVTAACTHKLPGLTDEQAEFLKSAVVTHLSSYESS
jgi:uncharacterized protein